MKKFKLGVGLVAKGELIKGASDEEALRVVMNHFPEAKTTQESIRRYRTWLRSNGYDVPTSSQAKCERPLRLVA